MTSLETAARSILSNSIRAVGTPPNEYIYPASCSEGLVDTTTTLLAARALAKTGRSDLAWSFVKTVFSAQGSNGFLPRYLYLNFTDEYNTFTGAPWVEFMGSYPGPKLFPARPAGYLPQAGSEDSEGSRMKIHSSNTLSAPPSHATAVLDIFFLSNQTSTDVDNLLRFFHKLQRWHGFLHRQTAPNCTLNAEDEHKENPPCLLVKHPWETEVELTSPIWQHSLGNATFDMVESGWFPSFEIPGAVKNAYNYPDETAYNTALYLLDCLAKRSGDEQQHTDSRYRSSCPFAMVDVGFTALFAKSSQDLRRIQQILLDKHEFGIVKRETSWHEVTEAQEWVTRSGKMLHGLYSDAGGTYFNQIVNLTARDGSTGFESNHTAAIEIPDASSFGGLWGQIANETVIESVTQQLLQRSGSYSFNCGDFPLWSIGDCESHPSASIYPLLNYRVSRGLRYSKEVGLGHFFTTSTLDLMCGGSNSIESNYTCQTVGFASAFNATTGLALGSEECGLESTLTAAIALDMLIPDKPFKYASTPPISNSSVIFLIAVEMIIALGVGVACVVLSVHLMRRASADEEGDAFLELRQQVDAEEEEDLLVQTQDDSPRVDFAGWTRDLLSKLNPMNLIDGGGGQEETNLQAR